MEASFRAHPLWAGCSEEELESAGEGLEKYVMTKLFTRCFASIPDDVKADEQLSEKMALVQQFIRPENLDILPTFQNETSWLLAQKELQKINMFKAPREKLVCILSCCKVITNLLVNASMTSNESPPGADEFLPVLIYVTIKANPPQLHSNLLYIQRYRRQTRLVGEAAYFFTNMLSAESFITNIDAKSISMDETEFERNMESARALLSGLSSYFENNHRGSTPEPVSYRQQVVSTTPKQKGFAKEQEVASQSSSTTRSGSKEEAYVKNDHDGLSIRKTVSISDLEEKGAGMLLKEQGVPNAFQEFPYLFANVADLTVRDVEDLLSNYKKLVFKYICLSKGLGLDTPSQSHLLASSTRAQIQAEETPKGSEDDNNKTVDMDSKAHGSHGGGGEDSLSELSHSEMESSDSAHAAVDGSAAVCSEQEIVEAVVPPSQVQDGVIQ
ncbi:Vacuolar protein sorting-associated protein 9A, variant 2 [Dionaea muscipula]